MCHAAAVVTAAVQQVERSETALRVEEAPAPVELVDVLDVPEESAHLLGTDGQVALIDDVSQVILQGAAEGVGGRNQSITALPCVTLSSRRQPDATAHFKLNNTNVWSFTDRYSLWMSDSELHHRVTVLSAS